MRRLSAAVTCLALVPVLGGLAACSRSDEPSPSTTTTTAPVGRQAGAAATSTGGLGPGKLAMFVLEGVFQGIGAQGYTFLSDLLTGDSDGVTAQATADKLDSIGSQLQQITDRLDAVHTEINSLEAQIADGDLSKKLDEMNQWNNKMRTLYTEYFLPVSDAAKEVSVAKQKIADAKAAACGTPTTSPAVTTPKTTTTTTPTTTTTCPDTTPVPSDLTDALATTVAALDKTKTAFDTAFGQADPYTVFSDQHDALYPDIAGVSSVLKLAGTSLESKGYVTWTDSQRLKSMYQSLSDQEALSALLVFEHDRMFGVAAATQQRHRDDYQAANAVEVANLSPEIPWAQVKVGARMFKVPAYPQDTSYGPWLPISPEGKQLGTHNPLDKETENPGWTLTTDAQLTALFDGTKGTPIVDSYMGMNNQGPTTHLGSIWQNSGYVGSLAPRRILAEQEAMLDFGRTWYWTKDTSTSNTMECTVGQSRTVNRVYTLHHIGNMRGATAIELQGQPGRIPDRNPGSPSSEAQCDDELVRLYNNDTYSGYVILTQPIPSDVDYMAQRSTALPAPTPTTPMGTTTAGS